MQPIQKAANMISKHLNAEVVYQPTSFHEPAFYQKTAWGHERVAYMVGNKIVATWGEQDYVFGYAV